MTCKSIYIPFTFMLKVKTIIYLFRLCDKQLYNFLLGGKNELKLFYKIKSQTYFNEITMKFNTFEHQRKATQ